MFKKDNLRLGIVLGFLAPVAGLIIYYLVAFLPRHVAFTDFLQ